MTKRKLATLEILEDGNTNPPKSINNKQVIQLKEWFMTWNNYPDNAPELLETIFKEISTKYKFQEETGKNGTKHIQGNFFLKKKMRPSEFRLPKQIHWEKTRNSEAAMNYCTKEESCSGKKYSFGFPKPLRLITNLRYWQTKIVNLIKQECLDERTINWFWEPFGYFGKSKFTKYLVCKYNAAFINYAKPSDLINVIYNTDMDECNLVVIDIPKSIGNNVCYTVLEEIKNGLICNTKFETGKKVFNSPHIVIFANEPPIRGKLSPDRWNIVNLWKENWKKIFQEIREYRFPEKIIEEENIIFDTLFN